MPPHASPGLPDASLTHDLRPIAPQSISLNVQEYDDGAEFDGGDSGSGAVGDGNVDLQDQHNSATLGALRGGVADLTGATMDVGRGRVQSLVDPQATRDSDGYANMNEGDGKVSGATQSRTAAAGANYFGRSTGLADKLIDDITEEQRKSGRMDCVRAQQKENWFNQRAIHKNNRAQGQGVVFGESAEGRPSEGGFIARESISSSAWRAGASDNEISQRDLANHLSDLAAQPAERLDGGEWGPLAVTQSDQIEESFEVRASPRQTDVTEIAVRNDFNTFAPFRCALVPGSSSSFSVTPNHGSMNRRSGDPVDVTVRFTPQETGVVHEAYLIFETEDMKKVYHFTGST